MSLLSLVSPKNQNNTQKVGFFFSIFLALVLIFLHYPFNGYTYHENESLCTLVSHTAEQLKVISQAELSKPFDEYHACVDNAVNNILPISEWRSNEPITMWFGSTLHLAVALLFNFLACICWLWIFKLDNTTYKSD